jgi:hypothetical protein
MDGKISHIRQVSQCQKMNKVRMDGKISHMEIEKRNAWQNKPHKTEQGKDRDRQKKCMAK